MWMTLGLCAIGVGLLYLYLVWNFGYWSKRGVPGPGAWPLTGSFPWAFLQRQNIVYELEEIYKKYRGKTPFIGVYASRTPVLMLLDPKYIKTALTTNFKHFHDNDFGLPIEKDNDPLLGRNPFMLTGDEWKEKRADITPAFTNSKLKTMYPIMQHVCTKLTSHVNDELDKKPVDGLDAKELAAKFTTDVVANCIYGIDSGALSGNRSVMRDMASEIFSFSVKFMVYFTLVQVLPWVRCVYNMPFVEKRIETFFTQLTRDAVKLRQDGGVQRDDFLNYLLQMRSRKPMSDIEMAAHTMTFFLDGYETSSAVIAHVLLQLAKDEKVQTRLRAELEQTVGETTDSVSYEQILAFEYLDQVVHETLRLVPVVALLSKACTESIELSNYEGDRVTIEKGTMVQIPVYSVQHDAEFYPEPERFDPDRFGADNGGLKKFKDDGLFLTFGDGPRICLGMRFGLMQVKAAVVEIVRNYELSVNVKTQSPAVFEPTNFMLMPIGGIWLDLKPLKKVN